MSKAVSGAFSLSLVVCTFVALGCSGGDDSRGTGIKIEARSSPAPGQSTGGIVSPPAVAPQSQAPAQPTPAPAAASSGAGACSLITKQDASTVLGGAAVGDAKAISVPPQSMGPGFTVTVSSCSFDATAGFSSVAVDMWKGPSGQDAQIRLFAQTVCGNKERVSGIGDTACWYSAEHTEFQVFKGATFLDIRVTGAKGDVTEALKNLARTAVGRIQ